MGLTETGVLIESVLRADVSNSARTLRHDALTTYLSHLCQAFS